MVDKLLCPLKNMVISLQTRYVMSYYYYQLDDDDDDVYYTTDSTFSSIVLDLDSTIVRTMELNS